MAEAQQILSLLPSQPMAEPVREVSPGLEARCARAEAAAAVEMASRACAAEDHGGALPVRRLSTGLNRSPCSWRPTEPPRLDQLPRQDDSSSPKCMITRGGSSPSAHPRDSSPGGFSGHSQESSFGGPSAPAEPEEDDPHEDATQHYIRRVLDGADGEDAWDAAQLEAARPKLVEPKKDQGHFKPKSKRHVIDDKLKAELKECFAMMDVGPAGGNGPSRHLGEPGGSKGPGRS